MIHRDLRAAASRVLHRRVRGYIADEKSKSFRHGLWLGIATQPAGYLAYKLLHWFGVI